MKPTNHVYAMSSHFRQRQLEKKEALRRTKNYSVQKRDSLGITSASERVKNRNANSSFCAKLRRRISGEDLNPYVVVTLVQMRDDDDNDIFTHRTKTVWKGGGFIMFKSQHQNSIKKRLDKAWDQRDTMLAKVICWQRSVVGADHLIGMRKLDVTQAFIDGEMSINGELQFDANNSGLIELKVIYNEQKMKVRLDVIAAADLVHHKMEDSEDVVEVSFGAGKLIALVLVYFGTALVFYSYYENWTSVETIYFAFTAITTVGYGDFPMFISSDITYTFTSFFIIIGFCFTLVALSLLVSYLVSTMEANESDILEEDPDVLDPESKSAPESGFSKNFGKCNRIRKCIKKVPKSAWTTLSIASLGVVCTMNTSAVRPVGEVVGRKLIFKEALYYTCVTLTMVGFGDFSPATNTWKVAAMIWFLFGTLSITKLLGDVMDIQQKSRYIKKKKQRMRRVLRNKKDFAAFDEDGDGEISELEFLVKMLSRLKVCPDSDVASIRKQFRLMDQDGSGSVDMDELSEYMMLMKDRILKKEKKRASKSSLLVGRTISE